MEFEGADSDLAELMATFGASEAVINITPDVDIEGIARLLAGVAKPARPCSTCGGAIRSERRRLTCSPACLSTLVERRWRR